MAESDSHYLFSKGFFYIYLIIKYIKNFRCVLFTFSNYKTAHLDKMISILKSHC